MSPHLLVNPGKESWNGLVSALPGASIYQSYEWGQFKQALGWQPHYLAVLNGRGAVAAALVLGRPLPAGMGTILYSPAGPVLREATEDGLQMLLEGVREVTSPLGPIFWRIEPRVEAGDPRTATMVEKARFIEVPQEWSYWNRPKYDLHLDLTPGESALFKGLGEKNRWNVRAAMKKVRIERGTGEEHLLAFHALLRQTGLRKRILVRTLDYYRRARNVLVESGRMEIFLARHNDRPVAGGISTLYGQVGMLVHTGNDYSVPKVGYALQWEMIRWALENGCCRYDFGGTGTSFPPRETDPGYGVYKFKSAFGARIVRWHGYADYVFKPLQYRILRGLERGLPYGERVILAWPKWLQCRFPESSLKPGPAVHRSSLHPQ